MKHENYSLANTIVYYLKPFCGAVMNIVGISVFLMLIVFGFMFVLNYIW